MTKYYRLRKAGGKRKSWSIEEKVEGKWVTVESAEMASVSASFKEGALSYPQAFERSKRLLKALYVIRDQDRAILNVLPGNETLLEKFLLKAYTPQKRVRMGEKSVRSAMSMLKRAIHDLGDLAVDGPSEPLQDLLDQMYKDKPGSHRKRITAINRLRKHLSLSALLHLSDVGEEAIYVSADQFKALQSHIKNDVTRLLANFLFHTGLRLGEAFAVTPQSLRTQGKSLLVMVTGQMYVKGKAGATKTRSKRKAFVIPGGEEFVRAWAALPDKAKYRDVEHNKRIKKAAAKIGVHKFYLHCLRHSYCVHLIGNGCTIDWVAQCAGHSRAVCERYYSTHSLTDDAITMMELKLSKDIAVVKES